jgi:hypothetical protein
MLCLKIEPRWFKIEKVGGDMKMNKEEIKEDNNKIIIENPKPKEANPNNVKKAEEILRLGTLKKLVDAFMSSVNKSNKSGVKDAADKLIGACINVAGKLDENIEQGKKIDLNAKKGISDENVEKFDTAYLTVLKDLSKSSYKKEKKLATSMSNVFPHWCLSLAQKLQNSNFYKRLSNAEDKNKNTNKDDGKAFDVAKKENSNGVMYELKKKYKNLFSGKARKHETFNKIKNLVVRYSEPWAIAWVNAAKDGEPISESSAIKEINALCKKKDVDFIQDLGDENNFKLAGSFSSIFGENFVNNSGKIKKSLKSIIDRLVSISKKLEKEKYKEEDAQKISGKINTYNEDKVFKEVFDEPSIFSKAWGKITTAASTVGGGIKTAGGKVLSGAKAVGSGIVKGGKLLGKGVLAVATAPKYIVPGKIRNKIYDRFHKKGKEEEELHEFDDK